MSFNADSFKEHLEEAAKATSPYSEFDALWKAFNVYYVDLYRADDPRRVNEIELIHRAVRRVPQERRVAILTQTLTQRFRQIQPIADGQMWARFGQRLVGGHIKACLALDEVWAGAAPEVRHLETVSDVLYLVRCNMAHGQKSRHLKRDTDVFEATLPILRALVRGLPDNQPAEGAA